MTIVVLGTLRFPSDRIASVRPHLEAVVTATRRHDGCTAYDVAEDPFDPGLIRFSEIWPDAALLEAHLKAPQIEPCRAAARSHGLISRKFTAYEANNPNPV